MAEPLLPNVENNADALRSLMQRVGIVSYRALADRAGVSRWQVQQLRQGNLGHMRLHVLEQLATALELSVTELLQAFEFESASPAVASASTEPSIEEIKKEYDRLREQLALVKDEAQLALKKEILNELETWLVQWPTIAHKALENETLAAAKVVKFVEPVMRLVEGWGISAIAPVGSTLPYDPQQHQLMNGTADPGDAVRIRYAGYTYQGKLLHRAKVSPLSEA